MGQRVSVICRRKNGYARAVNDPRDDDDGGGGGDFSSNQKPLERSSAVTVKLVGWMSRVAWSRPVSRKAAERAADVAGETSRNECEACVCTRYRRVENVVRANARAQNHVRANARPQHQVRANARAQHLTAAAADDDDKVHTSVDYIHFLVPDLLQITNGSFYWGKMDRYEAERLLNNAPEGTFLLRDSAHDEYTFSVSFRKHGRSLHARIEQWDRRFSLDARDPSVFSSPTVCGLLEHYKDPSNCMFFEPTLTVPFPRNFVFSLQHACRATVLSRIAYEDINQLPLPKTLKSYLKEYHYKQRVRTRKFDSEN